MTLNFSFPDVGESYALELSNGVLNNAAGVELANADASVTLDRTTLDAITLGQTTTKDAVASGEITIEGDKSKLGELFSYLDGFDFWFNIVTPNPATTN
jgi:alkyl sulfatase BDS1-like metallo-beta-lactamase superfamily hydrolase